MPIITSAPIRSRAACALALPGLAALLAGTPAAAQGLLPAGGIDVRTGNLRSQLERAYQAGPPLSTPGWTVTSGVDLEAAWSDPVQGAGGGIGQNKGGDIYTILSPQLSVFGQSQRVQGGLFLAPELRGYLSNGKLNSYNTNFSGQAHTIVVEDAVFVDLTGSSSMQSRNGGMASSSSLNSSNSVQTTSFTLAPSAQHEFGDYGTAMAGYSLSETTNSAQAGQTTTSNTNYNNSYNSPFVAPLSTAPMTSNEMHASFKTGDFLGQTAATLHTSIRRTSGGGALSNSSRDITALDVERYLDREWTLLTSVGVEDIRYTGTTPRRYNNGTWSAGTRWIPNADSTITVTYGRHDGSTALMLDANYAATSRTRFSANYSEGITTGQEDAQNAISSASLNSSGQFINPQTGVPISANNNFFGTQTNSAYRFKRASATASLMLDRDVFTFSVNQDNQTLISAGTAGAPTATSGVYGSLAVQHELNPAMNASVFVQIGQRQSPNLQTAVGHGSASEDTRSLGGTFTYIMSETLSARAQYSYTSTTSNTPGLSQTQNLILVGLHKTF